MLFCFWDYHLQDQLVHTDTVMSTGNSALQPFETFHQLYNLDALHGLLYLLLRLIVAVVQSQDCVLVSIPDAVVPITTVTILII